MTTIQPILTLDTIATLCQDANPAIIYFAIGCSLYHYEPGKHPRQQYPPFMAKFPGRQICILMDPLLESPPRAYADLGINTNDEIATIRNVTFIPVRRNFEWNSPEAIAFIDRLCSLCLRTHTRLIVQDYSGHYIEHNYPIDRFGSALTKKVLFDVTYRDGGCFIDLDAVKILMHRDGGFIQPKHDPIAMIRSHVSPEQLRYVLKERRNDIVNYVKRYHRIQTGVEEYRDWCTADVVLQRMRTLCGTYRVTPDLNVSISCMEQLMVAYLFDLCVTVGDRVTEEAAIELIRSPNKEYEHMLLALEDVLLTTIENPHPV